MNARLFSSLEPLEARIAPAGVVNVAASGGSVKIVGDALANDLTIAIVGAGDLLITGNGGTTVTFNGTTGPTALVETYAKDLSIALGDGVDTVNITNGAYYGNITLDGGDKRTVFSFTGAAPLVVPGSLKLLAKDGVDAVNIDTDGNDFQVGRDLSLTLGEGGFDSLVTDAKRMIVGGKLVIKGGGGVENLSWTPTSDFVVSGDVNIDTGKSFDRIAINPAGDTAINGKLTVKGGNAAVPPSNGIGAANLGIRAGDEMSVRGAVSVTTVDGTSLVTLGGVNSSNYASAVTIKTGKGKTTVTMQGAKQTFLGKVSIAASGATDFVFNVTSFFMSGELSFKGSKAKDSFDFSGDGIVAGKVGIDLGDGAAQTLSFRGTTGIAVFGDLTLKQGAKTGASTTTVSRIDASRSFNLTTAGADDTITLDNLTVAGATNISAGAGNDTLLFETTGIAGLSSLAGFLKVLMGDGTDNVTMGVTGDANNRIVLDAKNRVEPPKFEGLLDQGAGQDAFSGFNNRGNIGNLQVLGQES